ncbi:MAG: hypothetical protein MNPFHGCM_00581 [Gemmatimonadaceae bacterium]|nr:hypothetical protein [Gemmatimonadaceae bacterium]
MSAQTVVTAEQPPSPPGLPVAPQVPGQTTRVLSARDVTALREQRAELSRQLTSAAERRENLAKELKGTEGDARQGLLARIEVLDNRIVQLETDIAATGRELSNAPRELVTSTEPPARIMGLEERNFTQLAGAFTIFVLFPLTLAFARLMWKRATVRVPPKDADAERRMERIEQAIDTIALEVERVAENQRYATRLLAEANGLASLPAGQGPAEPIRIPERAGVREM